VHGLALRVRPGRQLFDRFLVFRHDGSVIESLEPVRE